LGVGLLAAFRIFTPNSQRESEAPHAPPGKDWRREAESSSENRRRLPIIVNNCRFLLLSGKTFPNLGSRSLRLVVDRLSADWQKRYSIPCFHARQPSFQTSS